MSAPSRIFVALPIPRDRAEKLSRLQSLIAPELPAARWVEPEKFHVTLAFLGDVPDADITPLCREVASASAALRPLELFLEGLGVFPDPLRPRVVWAGLVGDDVTALKALREAVAEAATRAGYPPSDDRFSPHVTLGRMKPGRGPSGDCSPLLRHYERWRGGAFVASEVVTFASGFDSVGPVYMPLGRAPLRGSP